MFEILSKVYFLKVITLKFRVIINNFEVMDIIMVTFNFILVNKSTEIQETLLTFK